MNRGRPTEQAEVLEKYKQIFYEYPTKPELGYTMTWFYDKSKAPNGPYKTECTYPRSIKFPTIKPDKGKAYGKMPVVMVFKTSNRSNAKVKMKVWNNENIDYIASANKLPGVPDRAVILELAVGRGFIEKYQSLYNL
tara:strand:- start:303 stop:713 length:411 start_codon:yes stop_codon:yes gene_type:complete